MLKPTVRIKVQDGFLVADFWDCLRLDPVPVKELRTALEKHVRGGGHAVAVVDLTGVSFAGSTALGGFVAMRKQGARIVFHSVEPTVREVFRVSNLATLFRFVDDEAQALEAAKGLLGGTGEMETQGPARGTALPTAPPPLRRGRRESQ